jgi:hypothetical protein
MALAVNNLATSSSGTNTDTYTTASFTPTASSLIIACYSATNGALPPTPTVTGGSLTWTAIDNFLWDTTTQGKLFVFAAQASGSPSSMTVTFDHGVGSGTIGAEWSVFEATGSDVANGVSQCFVQKIKSTADSTGTSVSITLAAASNSNNRPFLWVIHFANQATTERTNWTEIGDTNHSLPSTGAESQWRSDTFETTASASWLTSSGFGAIAFEIKAGSATATNHSLSLLGVGA